MTHWSLFLLSAGIIFLITSFFISYYVKNHHNCQNINFSFSEIDTDILQEIESNLIEDYHHLRSEMKSYHNTNDYIKQERSFIMLIQNTIAQEELFKKTEAELKSDIIQIVFDQYDITEIQFLIKEK